MLPTRFWAEMTWRDFAEADMPGVVAVLPVAAIEQHGPHLPVGVDAFINEGYLARAAVQISKDLPVLFLPLQPVGVSLEHSEFPGTLALSAETAIRALIEIGDSVARAGCRKLVVMNSHGGNVAAIDTAALELRRRWRMLVVNASWRRLGYPDGLFSAREMEHGVHAGDAETSLMLAFRPSAASLDAARDFPSADETLTRDFALLRAKPPLGFAWMASDLNPDGAMGEAARASEAKGEAAADYGVERFLKLIEDVCAFDLARLRDGPLGRSR